MSAIERQEARRRRYVEELEGYNVTLITEQGRLEQQVSDLTRQLEGARQQIDAHQTHVLELIEKRKESEAGAATMRVQLESDKASFDAIGVPCTTVEAALSPTAGVAMLERVQEFRRCLVTFLKNNGPNRCKFCQAYIGDRHLANCIYRKAQELLKRTDGARHDKSGTAGEAGAEVGGESEVGTRGVVGEEGAQR